MGSTGWKPTKPPKQVNSHVNFRTVPVQVTLF
jgi:hypothetical protein